VCYIEVMFNKKGRKNMNLIILCFIGMLIGSITGYVHGNFTKDDYKENFKAFLHTFCFVITAFVMTAAILMLIY